MNNNHAFAQEGRTPDQQDAYAIAAPKGRSLTSDEEAYIVNVLERWLGDEMRKSL